MTLRDWLKQLKQEPTDWELFGPFSDWLEECGKTQQAHAIRWMAKHRQTPVRKEQWWTWELPPGYDSVLPPHDYFFRGTLWQKIESLGRGLAQLKKTIQTLSELYEI